MDDTSSTPFEFSVTIDDSLLDMATVERIEKKLSDLVLGELAHVDLAGRLVTEPLPTARSFGDGSGGGFGGGVAGFHVSRA
jgi:hypothetical protein